MLNRLGNIGSSQCLSACHMSVRPMLPATLCEMRSRGLCKKPGYGNGGPSSAAVEVCRSTNSVDVEWHSDLELGGKCGAVAAVQRRQCHCYQSCGIPRCLRLQRHCIRTSAIAAGSAHGREQMYLASCCSVELRAWKCACKEASADHSVSDYAGVGRHGQNQQYH